MDNPPHPQRKHPAHCPPIERHNLPTILLVTLAIQPRRKVLANPTFHQALLEGAQLAETWNIGLYVIMPDHIHLFCRPGVFPPVNVNRWNKYLKACITRALPHPRNWDWQPRGWDRQMRSQQHYRERYAYVSMNPVRAGLVMEPGDWPYQGEINKLDW